MPKVVVTAAKGLVQSAGAGFTYLDFLSGYQGNLTGTANEITDAEAEAADIAGSPTAAQTAAATLTTNALNTAAIDGNGGVGSIFLPAAYAGTHVAVKLTANANGSNKQTIVASHGTSTKQSAEEGVRQAAGGTAAVFAAGYVIGDTARKSTLSDGADTKLELTANSSNSNIAANSYYHFFCPEDGVWLVSRFGPIHGTGGAMTFA